MGVGGVCERITGPAIVWVTSVVVIDGEGSSGMVAGGMTN